MIYRVFSPSPALSEIVSHFWYSKVDLSGAILQYYPTPLLQGLVFNFRRLEEHHAYNNKVVTLDKQAYLFGQPISPRETTTHKEGIDIIGASFKPLGITKVTGINMEHMADQIIAAEDIWGRELEWLCDEMQSAGCLEGIIRVLETFLLDKYTHTRLHYRVDHVGHALSLIEHSHGIVSIKDLQYQTSTSRKTLERAFLNYVGLKPKLYSQIVRYNAAKERIDKMLINQNIAELAYDTGYYDGSHFAAEFKRFSGVTPREYIHNAIKADAEGDARSVIL
jgi:AraC-like DNA-binding protein